MDLTSSTPLLVGLFLVLMTGMDLKAEELDGKRHNQKDKNLKYLPDSADPAKELFQRLFKRRRAEHLEAVKGLLRLGQVERQYKMLSVISEKIFSVIQSSRATLESSDYVPGSQFPQDATVQDALSSILENTALMSELVLRLPDLAKPMLTAHHDWEILLHWSIGFCLETALLDTASLKLLNLVSQELGLIEPELDYINPYHKKTSVNAQVKFEPVNTPSKPRKRNKMKKGPQLSRTEL